MRTQARGLEYGREVSLRFFVYFAIATAGVSAALYSFESQRFELRREKLQEAETLRMELAAKTVARNLRVVISDLSTLAQSQILLDYLQDDSQTNTLRLQNEFLNLARHAAIYDQVRYIDRTGHERIRINFINGSPVAAGDDRLQDKSNRYYFREAISLDAGQIYLSLLDLNVEDGAIERPFKPMIRAAIPVFDRVGTEPVGILVLNYLGSHLFAQFEDVMVDSWGEAMILNKQGHWLYAPAPQDSRALLVSEEKHSFAERYPSAWKWLVDRESGTFRTEEGQFTFVTLRPHTASILGEPDSGDASHVWKVVSRVDSEALTFSPWQGVRDHLKVLLTLAVVTGIVSVLIAWMRTNNIYRAKALRESERYLEQAQHIAHIGNWVWDVRSGNLTWSDEIYRIFGLEPQQFRATYEAFLETVHPEDRPLVTAAVDAAFQAKAPYAIDHRIVLPDKTVRVVHERGEVTFDTTGEPVRMLGTVQDITVRKRAEEALQDSEQRVRLLFESVGEGIVGVDKQGRCTFVNPAALHFLRYQDPSELLGRNLHALIHHTRADGSPCWEDECRINQSFRENREFQVDDEIFWRADGSCFDVGYRFRAILQNGNIIGSVVTFSDITERKEAEEQLRRSSIVFANSQEAIMVTDPAHNIIMVNDAFTTITGFAANEVLGEKPSMQQSGRHDEAFYQGVWTALDRSGHWQGEIWNRRKNGEVYPAWENISAVKDDTGRLVNFVSMFSDISTIKEAEERLNHLAHHDALTGLPNRLLFTATLEQALTRAERHRNKLALMFLDLDHFKLVNDTLGHAAGDRLLQIVAERLKSNMRAVDMVARLGGDEFTILLEEISHAEDAAALAEDILRTVARPITLDDREMVTSTSMGISLYPDDATNAEDLAKAADAAMYRAKNRGRHTYEFYTSELTAQALERLTMESGLRQALERNEFRLYYQPQIEVETGRVRGVEALLRWRHPEWGMMLPDKFIGIAEDSGLIGPIGEWVLRKAAEQARLWREAGVPSLRIAVNLSGRQVIYGHLINTIQDVLRQNGLETGDVLFEIEITESILQSAEQVADTFGKLRGLGFSIAVDDFGTGYSSLSHLKHLPIDTLKVDRMFMQNVIHDPDNRAITTAIITMAHSLGLRVVAEGVETMEQLNFLRELECDEAQGFLISEAIAPEDVARFLETGHERALSGQ